MDKVLTMEFTFLGNDTAICVEGDASMVKYLDWKMAKHLNHDKLIVDRKTGGEIYKRYSAAADGNAKRGSRKRMLYFID